MRICYAVVLLVPVLSTLPASGGETLSETGKLAVGLNEKAEAEGLVRVIVEVKASEPVAEGKSVARDHCANIACAKLSLQKGLAETDAPLIEPFEDLPLILMEVSQRGLKRLEASPFVERVTADEPVGVTPIEEPPATAAPRDDSELSAPQSD